ncbi:MAG: LysR family transcriptional regulator [Pseudomonadota bacterium]
MANWDDYRFFANLVQTGSVRASADRLGVNPSTVTRRLDGLEGRLGVKLFVRSHAGLQLTADGIELNSRLEPLAADLNDLEATLSGRPDDVAGIVRITIPDVLAITLMPELSAYARKHPQVRLEFIPGYQALDLARGEADMAIRVTDSPPEDLIGRQLGASRLAVYGARDYLAAVDPLAEPEAALWIESGIETIRAPGYKARAFAKVPLGVRCNNILLQQAAAAAGMGITLLPCSLGDSDPRLERIGNVDPLDAQQIWLLIHPDLRGVARIQSVSSHILGAFQRLEDRLLGRDKLEALS